MAPPTWALRGLPLAALLVSLLPLLHQAQAMPMPSTCNAATCNDDIEIKRGTCSGICGPPLLWNECYCPSRICSGQEEEQCCEAQVRGGLLHHHHSTLWIVLLSGCRPGAASPFPNPWVLCVVDCARSATAPRPLGCCPMEVSKPCMAWHGSPHLLACGMQTTCQQLFFPPASQLEGDGPCPAQEGNPLYPQTGLAHAHRNRGVIHPSIDHLPCLAVPPQALRAPTTTALCP